ncbi:DUF2065 domain-containing protein [Sulfitobacter sp. F26204]|uniref:DUF2065 domain-containing protein n=1 Tax=Sulfitobacter sp. F26204 TaxID=2996014 RepID=UPI00225E6725|nr:DUF2065 domain-containing protein [Sulfitobacter sp. F26204]MCX7559285.1 DUF2065 domain-containing protein [Sulfitobacter sp. F26204]
MKLILLAVGLVMVFEGLVYALAPSFLERMLETLRKLPPDAVRQIGALIVVTGLVLIWGAFQIRP